MKTRYLGLAMAAVCFSVVADAQVNVGGRWNTSGGGQVLDMTLQQSGTNVTGSYTITSGPPGPPGTLIGQLSGNRLTGRWTDEQQSGGFTLTFTPDGLTFNGTFGTGRSNSNGGPWMGVRR